MIPVSHVDLNTLVILAQLLRTRSVTQSARYLGLSQPAVSRALSKLRDQLGDPLLVRSAGRMQLTQRAEDLAMPLRDWLEHTSHLLAPPRFDAARLARRFRVASTDFGVSTVVAPALAAIRSAAPGVELDIRPFTPDMISLLAAGDLDLIISGLDPDPSQTYERYLFTEHFCCLVDRSHPLARRATDRPLSLDEFLTWPHFSLVVSKSGSDFDRVQLCLGERARERRIIARLSYFQAAPELLLGSDAIMTIPSRAAHAFSRSHDLVSLTAPEIIGTFGYRLLWHQRSHRDPAIAWLCDMIASQTRA